MKAASGIRLILSLLLGLATAGMCWIFPLGAMLAPGIYGYISVIWGKGCLALGLLTACAGTGAIMGATGEHWALLLGAVGLFLPSALIIGYGLKSFKPYRSMVAACSVAIGLALYMSNCVPALMEGLGPFAYFEEYAAEFGQLMLEVAEEQPLSDSQMEYIGRIAAAARYMARDAAVMTMVGMSMAAGFANVLLARTFSAHSGAKLAPMAPFESWQLSPNFVSGCLILLIGALVVMGSNIPNSSAIVTALQVIVAGPYVLMGLCLMAYARKRRARSRTFFTVSCVLMVLLLPYSLYGLCFMGAFDRILRLRRRGV